MSSMNILINEEYNDLHTLYYILKLHNNSHRERYIVCSSTCSTIELSITMTQLLSAVKEGLQFQSDKVYSRNKINQIWTLKNSKDLLDMFTCAFSKISSIQHLTFLHLTLPFLMKKLKTCLKEIASSASLIYQQFPHMEFIFHNSHVTIELAVFSRFFYNVVVF